MFDMEKKEGTEIVASIAKQHDYDDILYLVDNSNSAGDTICISVGDNISKRIKTFNKNR